MKAELKKNLQKISEISYCSFGYEDSKEILELMEYSIKDNKQLRQIIRYIKEYLDTVDKNFEEYRKQWKMYQKSMEEYF